MPLSANDFGVEIDETEPRIDYFPRTIRGSVIDRFFFRDTYEIGYDSSGLNVC